jgi:hypothetical protein
MYVSLRTRYQDIFRLPSVLFLLPEAVKIIDAVRKTGYDKKTGNVR